jgi:hypothetical protein
MPSQYHPTRIAQLSNAQISKLLNGHRIRMKHGNHHIVHLSNEQHKKIHMAHKKGCGVTIEFDPFQQQMHEHHKLRHGHGMMDFLKKAGKSAFKAVAPIAIDEGSKFLKSQVEGMGVRKHKTKKHSKRGAGFLDDLESGLIHVGIPTAGHFAGEMLGGPAGALAGEALGNFGADAIGNLTGRGVGRKRGHKRHGGALMPAGY